jgi:hypothetical protein
LLSKILLRDNVKIRVLQDKAILYWFRPPESKTLHPVLHCIHLIIAKVEVVRVVLGRTPLPTLYWATFKAGEPES